MWEKCRKPKVPNRIINEDKEALQKAPAADANIENIRQRDCESWFE